MLVIESDDWGAGPLEQAERLVEIAAVLAKYPDRDGRKAVMTLGVVLGIPDGRRIVADDFRTYYRKSLEAPEFTATLTAIRYGVENGVFAPQLHGGEHYWPPALLAAARSDPAVAAWLRESALALTEALPAPLQSRWIDASTLPSKPLGAAEVNVAALAEAKEFSRIFRRKPQVAVPPTFIWNDAVESAWAQGGVQFVVTPGRRYEARGTGGEPTIGGPAILNGNNGAARIGYVVRDDYFEPTRGHRAEYALSALAVKTLLGRPTLLETHRANFVGDAATTERALRELDRLLKRALQEFPTVAFLTTEELAVRMRCSDPQLVERAFAARLQVWLRRLWQLAWLRKLALLTGAVLPAWLLYLAVSAVVLRAPKV